MRFLMLIHDRGEVDAGPPPDSLIEAVTELRADTSLATWLDDGGLMPADQAAWVRMGRGGASIVDGPFTEAKELVGGFFVLEAANLDDARAWALKFAEIHAEHWPELAYDAELRQVAEGVG